MGRPRVVAADRRRGRGGPVLRSLLAAVVLRRHGFRRRAADRRDRLLPRLDRHRGRRDGRADRHARGVGLPRRQAAAAQGLAQIRARLRTVPHRRGVGRPRLGGLAAGAVGRQPLLMVCTSWTLMPPKVTVCEVCLTFPPATPGAFGQLTVQFVTIVMVTSFDGWVYVNEQSLVMFAFPGSGVPKSPFATGQSIEELPFTAPVVVTVTDVGRAVTVGEESHCTTAVIWCCVTGVAPWPICPQKYVGRPTVW